MFNRSNRVQLCFMSQKRKMTAEGDKKEQELFTFYSFINAYMIIFLDSVTSSVLVF